MFLCDNHWNFLNFSILQLWKKFFEKRKYFSQKLDYRFLVEIIKIENATFAYKTALLEKQLLR